MEVEVTKYNFLRKRMRRLEECYKQSCDQNVRKAVRDRTLFEISEEIDGFYEMFAEMFNECEMSSLMEIVNLIEKVMENYSAKKLPQIDIKDAKKILKLKEKDVKDFVKDYNKAVIKEPLLYYSKQIDQKVIFLTQIDGEFIANVGQSSKNSNSKETLCCFCNQFRRGDEIMFATTKIGNKNEYKVIGQYCCSDYQKCNHEIENIKNLETFLTQGKSKNKSRKK